MRLIEQLRWWAKECERTNFGCQARSLLIEAAEALEKAPTIDAVPVVRCKDCKYYQNGRIFTDTKFCFRLKDRKGKEVGYNWSDNDFCSYGERKE